MSASARSPARHAGPTSGGAPRWRVPALLTRVLGDARVAPRERWLWLGAVLGTTLLIVYPLGMFLIGGFRSAPWGDAGAHWTLDGFRQAYGDSHTWRLALNTLWIGLMTVTGVMAVAVSFAWLLTRTDIPAKRLLLFVATAPYFIPALVCGFSWSVLGNPRNGLLNRWASWLWGENIRPFNLYTHEGIAFVMITYIAPIAFLLIYPLFRSVDSSMEESSYASGGSVFRTLRRITLPVLAPGLLGVGLLMGIKALETFEIPFMLGQPSRINVFTTEIYAVLTFIPPADYARATALALLLVVVTAGVALPLQRYVSARQKAFVTVRGKGHVAKPTRLGGWRMPVLLLCLAYGFVTLLLPLYPILIAAFSKVFGVFEVDNFTLEHFAHVFETPLLQRGIVNSLLLAAGGATFGCIWALGIAYTVHRTRLRGRHLLDFACYLPVSIPGLVLGLALLWGYLATPGLSALYGTHWILLIAYMTVALPFALRGISAALLQIDPELEEAARMSGSGSAQVWRRVLIPLLRPGLMGAWTLLFIMIVREVGASVLLYNSDTVVLSVLVLDHWNSGFLGPVAAMSCVMIAIIVAAFALMRLLGGRFDAVS
ncbi:MAG: iron ABC transporter permease [Burkholderiaceae bacterium]